MNFVFYALQRVVRHVAGDRRKLRNNELRILCSSESGETCSKHEYDGTHLQGKDLVIELQLRFQKASISMYV
jgi:hypothetical protein